MYTFFVVECSNINNRDYETSEFFAIFNEQNKMKHTQIHDTPAIYEICINHNIKNNGIEAKKEGIKD